MAKHTPVDSCDGCEDTECPSVYFERVEFLRQALDAIDQAGVPLDVQSKVQALLRGWDESALDVAWMALQAEIEEQVNGDFSAAEYAFSVARDSLANSGE